MATLKTKSKESNIVTADFIEENVFKMLAGYKDEEGNVHKEFALREMTGKDEEAINKPDVKDNVARLISILLTRCVTRIGTITPKSVGAEEWRNIIKNLYSADQDYMLVKLREISIGDEIVVSHTCPNSKCKAKLKTEMLLSELEIKPYNGIEKVPFELPKGFVDKDGNVHKTGVIRRATGIDREVTIPVAKNNLSKAETLLLTRLCQFDDDVYADEETFSNLTIRDRSYLEKLLTENDFGIDLNLDVTCPECGEEFKGTLNVVNFM